jgi:hypothetical protein
MRAPEQPGPRSRVGVQDDGRRIAKRRRKYIQGLRRQEPLVPTSSCRSARAPERHDTSGRVCLNRKDRAVQKYRGGESEPVSAEARGRTYPLRERRPRSRSGQHTYTSSSTDLLPGQPPLSAQHLFLPPSPRKPPRKPPHHHPPKRRQIHPPPPQRPRSTSSDNESSRPPRPGPARPISPTPARPDSPTNARPARSAPRAPPNGADTGSPSPYRADQSSGLRIANGPRLRTCV